MRANALGVIVAANVALAAGLTFFWHDSEPFHWVEPVPIKPALDDLAAPTTEAMTDTARYRETLERPLFAATRRPAARDVAGEDKPRIDPLKDVRLLGLYGAGKRGGALVRVSGKLERVAFGGKIGDWTLEGEQGREATLVDSRGERRQLKLALNVDSMVVSNKGADTAAAVVTTPASSTRTESPASHAQAGAGGRRGAANQERLEQRRRDVAARINAARAQRGLPPLND